MRLRPADPGLGISVANLQLDGLIRIPTVGKTEMREFKTGTRGVMDAVNTRLDRLFLSLLAGLFVGAAAMAGVLATLGR